MRFCFTKEITVYRLSASSSKETYSENGNIKGYIAPISAEDAMLTDGNPSQTFKLVTDYDSNIEKTDKLLYDGEYYIIKGIQKFNFGALRRKEAILEQFNS